MSLFLGWINKNELLQYLRQFTDPKHGRLFGCFLCDHKPSLHKQSILNHIESTHLPYNEYQCTQCPKKLRTMNAYRIHLSRHRKKDIQKFEQY